MKNMSKQIQEICRVSKRGLRPQQVIDDMIQLGANLITEGIFIKFAFQNTLFGFSDEMRVELSRYKNDLQAWELLQQLFLTYTETIKQAEPFADVIEGMYDPYLNKSVAQFMTPSKLADGLMPFFDMAPITEPIRIGDPTGCGTGGLVLAQLRSILKTQGKEALKLLHVHAIDIDLRMVKMATVQVVLSACFHHLPVKSFQSIRANIITEYDDLANRKSYFWIPEAEEDLYANATKEFREFQEQAKNEQEKQSAALNLVQELLQEMEHE